MYTAIILAGGISTRMNKTVPKQFLALAGKPLIMHTLERLEKIELLDEIVVVCHSKYKELLQLNIDAYMLKKNYVIVSGGESRQQSTYNGLIASKNENVIIHEAARPFVTTEEFQKLLDEPCENVIYGIDIPFTVSSSKNGYIDGLLDRNSLINVQLPQKFNRKSLTDAHKKALEENKIFTEDASVLYFYNECEIKVIPGMHYNIKITDTVDLVSGELIYKEYIVGRD